MKVYYNPDDHYIDWTDGNPRQDNLEHALERCLTSNSLEKKVELLESFITNIVVKLAEKGVLTVSEINDALPKGSIAE